MVSAFVPTKIQSFDAHLILLAFGPPGPGLQGLPESADLGGGSPADGGEGFQLHLPAVPQSEG